MRQPVLISLLLAGAVVLFAGHEHNVQGPRRQLQSECLRARRTQHGVHFLPLEPAVPPCGLVPPVPPTSVPAWPPDVPAAPALFAVEGVSVPEPPHATSHASESSVPLWPEGLVQRVGGKMAVAAPSALRRPRSWARDESYARDAKLSYAFASWLSARLWESRGVEPPAALDIYAVATDPEDYRWR